MRIDFVGLVLHAIVMGTCVMTYWKAGEMEDRSGHGPSVMWAGASAALFLVMWQVLGWGWAALIGAQILLFVGIGVVRAVFMVRNEK